MLRCNKIIEFFFFLVEIKDRKLYRDSKVLQAGLGKKNWKIAPSWKQFC